ncbi:MAG: hypothetical protein WD558_02450, partial [Pseudomonadales bacterium]
MSTSDAKQVVNSGATPASASAGGESANVDDFDAAFNEAVGDEPVIDDLPADEPPADPPADAPADEPPADAPTDEPPADPPTDEPPADPPADAPADEPPAEPPADPPTDEPPADPPAGPRKVADYTAEELAELLNKPRDDDKSADPPKEPELDDYLTDEEREMLKAYEGEWKEVSQAESIRRRAEGQLLKDQIITEVAASLAPIVQHLQQSQVSGHFEAIQAAHPGYEKILPDVQKWVDTQPAILQPQMKSVLEKGSSAQVIQLFDLFKQSKTGAAPATPASSDTPQQKDAKKKAAEQERQKAAAATAAVTSRRDTKTGAKDDDDFDAAFDEAV